MDKIPDPGEEGLVTRREEAVALFQSRMTRWQQLQTGAFAVGGLGYVGYVGDQVSVPTFTLVLIVAALAIAVSAGVQAGHERNFRREMRDIAHEIAKVKPRRSNQ